MTVRSRSTVRWIVRTLSEICVTAGALIVLFVVYLLFWTGVRADSAMDGEIGRLQQQWSTGPVAAHDSDPTPTEPKPPAHPCPCCGGRMVIIETFQRGCSPRYRPAASPIVIRIDTS